MSDEAAARPPSLIDRLAALVGFVRAPPPAGTQIYWPEGNGDRGPPGSWQMNLNSGPRGFELLAFSAVYACIRTIADDVAKLPLQVFEIDMETGARRLLRRDYYAGLMRSPNGYQTRGDFMACYVQSYLAQGNAYAWCGRRNGRGEIAELHVLNPYRVTPLVADDGSIFYRCAEDRLAGIPRDAVVPERDVIHHRLTLLPGYPLVGVTPIFAAAASSAVGLKVLQNSQQFFANASRPSGFLAAPKPVSQDAAKRLAAAWDENYRGERYGKVAVLPDGMKWEPLTITAQDAQLIEQLRWSVEDVARVFRVPPFMLGDMTKVSYRNNEQLGRAYLTGCLANHLEALELRLARAFDFPPNFEIRFDLSAMLRTEIDVRFAAYTQSLNAGWQSINEVRAQEGLAPVEGGDEPRVQMQYVPLSQASEPPPEQPPPSEPAPPPDDEPAPPSAEPPPAQAPSSIGERGPELVLPRKRIAGRKPKSKGGTP